MANTEILLESGTNEIEIMEFMIYGELYGINVAKVKEIMMSDKVKPMPHAHSSVEGIFKPRDTMLTVVDLPFYLTGQPTERQPRDLFVITNFNKMNIAFRVQSVVGIQRISWNDIQKPDKTLNKGEEGVATGIAQCGGELVTILDFEKIVAEIAPETSIQIDEIDALGERQKNYARIICVEDSILLAKLIERALRQAGYVNLVQFNNGQEAWNYLQAIRDSDPEELREKAALIITDIEMPQMDGHRLLRLIRADQELKDLPVIIFSSLINEEMKRKGERLGADAQLSKNEFGAFVEKLDELLLDKGW